MFKGVVFTGWIYFQVLIKFIHTVKINSMSQIQQVKQFKMAAKSPHWLQESLKLRKITNKQTDTQNWLCSFQELHNFVVFSTRYIRFDIITSHKRLQK